jgi:gliding motility-associated-like protein
MKISKITFNLICLFVTVFTTIQVKAQGDDCTSAVTLTNLNQYCSGAKQFTNFTSTQSGYGAPSCWTNGGLYDVWFRFTAVGTDVQMSVTGGGTPGTIKRPNIVLYSGTCAGTINQHACAIPSAATPDAVSLYKGSLIPGTVYLIRISTTSANRGSFTFCISNYNPTVNPGADCDGAVKLCDKTDVKVAGLSGGGKNTNEPEGTSCFEDSNNATDDESNSSWYKWTCAQAGTLTFDIIPNDPGNDLDFILYELSGTSINPCGTRTILRCTATGCPVTNGVVGLNMTATDVSESWTDMSDPNACTSTALNGYLRYVNMVVGKTYVLMINNFTSSAGFTIKFGGTGIFSGPKADIVATGTPTTCVGETVIYNGSQSNNYSSLQWTFNGGTPGSSTTVGPHSVTYNTKGTYATYLKASDATCASGNSTDTVMITVNDATTTSNAGSAKTVCGDNATLAANTPGAGTGTWTLVSGKGTITSPNSPNSTVTGLGVGPNVFRWTIANPPCSSTTSTVTITGVGVPSSANAGPDQIICGGTTASLTANIPAVGTGKWTLVSGAGTITSPNSANTTVTALGVGNNVFRWSVANAPCSDATDDITIKRTELPVIDTTNMVITEPSCSKSDGAINGIVVTASSALTYKWNTVTYPSADIPNIPAGSYTLVVKDADGCTSTMGPISVVNPNPPNTPVVISGGDICMGDSIKVWIQNPLPGVIYTWTGPTGNALGTGNAIYINGATLADLGKYSATGSFSGCTGSTGFANVKVFERPKPVITGKLDICPGESTILSAINSTAGGNATINEYYWKYNGIKINPSNSSTITATNPGTYELVILNSNTCSDTSAKVTLKFNAPPVINETLVTIDSSNCSVPTGSITKITATGVPVLDYTWYAPPSLTPVFNSTTTADLKDVPAGTYVLVVKDGNNCKDTSTVFTLKDFHTPSVPGDIGNRAYCDGEALDPITVNGSGGIYTWYDTKMQVIFTGDTYTPTFTKTDTLFINETMNGCTSKFDTVIVVINPLPVGNAGPDKHILCSAPTIQLDGTGSTGGFEYNWIPSSGIASGGTTLTPQVKDAGTYTLTITDAKTRCAISDVVVVIKDPVPATSFTANPLTGEAPLKVDFTNTSTGSNLYLWEFGDKNTSTVLNPTNTYVNAGEYTVKLTTSDSSRCPSIAYTTIRVYEKYELFIPNVFTPNGDGKNDTYTIISSGVASLSGEIYDRWGLKLFSWDQKNDGWDGRSPTGSEVTDGTYFYILKIVPQRDPGATPEIKTGQVTLMR